MNNYYLYCNLCHTLFNPEYLTSQVCPIQGCKANALIELDELIAYQIRELNKMGYITDCCCSGHIRDIKDGFSGSYILFATHNESIEDVVKKYLSDYIEYKPFKSGLEGERRWELRFRDAWVEENIGAYPDYYLIIAFVDELNKLIHYLGAGDGYR